ncbi:hypothetical protein AB0F20_05950 [Streptomyces goshikiensis]|uniref:hypothetical protein n=1 Tax=Streptomyces goshikiensis TaxID=1942 RepID=UPI0033FC1E4F
MIRTADAVNAEIRALWEAAARDGRPVDAERYRRLVVEWAAAVRAEQELAA